MQEHIDALVSLVRVRARFQRDKFAANNRIKAYERQVEDDHIPEDILGALSDPHRLVIDHADQLISEYEKEIEKVVKQLPVWAWAKGVLGVGTVTLGKVLGEAGNLSNYPDDPSKSGPACLWRRFQLDVNEGVAPTLGNGKTKSPRRRAVMWNLGDSLIKAQVRQVKDEDGEDTGERNAIGYYGQVYLDRKQYEQARPWCGKCNPKDVTDPRDHCTDGHAHSKAKRYMEKRFLKELWIEWKNLHGLVDAD